MQNKFTIRLAGINIGISSLYPQTKMFCKEYLSENSADFSIEMTPEDIAFERIKSAQSDKMEGIPVQEFSDHYLETLGVYRKIVMQLLNHDIVLFHGSAIAVDGEAYLFTAKSGTGKSTHTRLWREQFGSRAVMVNDDKPLLKITDGKVLVNGTPWDGKHHLSSNISVPLKAICILNRDHSNHIAPISAKEAYPILLQQTYRPSDMRHMTKTLQLLDQLIEHMDLYTLGCNMEPSAAIVAYEGMNKRSDFGMKEQQN